MNKIECPLSAAAKNYERLPAIITGDRVISYGEYEKIVAFTAVRLKAKGVKAGTRVAIVSDHHWQYPVLLFALLRLGAVACPVNPRFPQKSIYALLRKLKCLTVVDSLNKLGNGPCNERRIIGLDVLFEDAKTDILKPASHAALYLSQDTTIVFTSGSSGLPKAALHSLANHYYNALGSNKNITVEPGDRWLLSLPLYHVSGIGILFRMVLGGGAVVIPPVKKDLRASIERYGVTHLSLVSTQLYRLLGDSLSRETIKQLKAVLVGGSAVPSALINRACEVGLPLYTTYGLTEMASQVTTTAQLEPRTRLSSSGRALDYRSLKIDNDEILVKGKTLFKGYVDGNATILPVDDEGWFRTGDLGHLDGEGYLTFLGRKDNMFISGGENIHPEEIERLICLFPHISEAVVVPIEDEEFGFRPAAFIRTLADRQVDEKDVVSYLEQYLPRFKIPIIFFKGPDKAGKGRLKPDRIYLAELAKGMKRK